MNYVIGTFLVLHGLVHLLYMGHSLRYFELEKGFFWPDNSLLFRNIFSRRTKKEIAAGLCIVAALFFIVSGIFAVTGHSHVEQVILIAVIASTVLYLVFWDGSISKLHTQGGIAIIINVVIFLYVFIIKAI